MSYTYINGTYEVTTPIHNGFKRFHSMNAQVAYTYDELVDVHNSTFEYHGYETWDFVSYAMPVLTVMHGFDTNMWDITIAYDAFNQSRSTNRQIARFLREINAPTTVYELRKLIESGFANLHDNMNNRYIHVRGEVNSMFTVAFYN